jgi:hypothetical protein
MRQQKRLPALLTGNNLDTIKSYPPSTPDKSVDLAKEIKVIGKDVKDLLKETKKESKTLISIEKILKKSGEERQPITQTPYIEKKDVQRTSFAPSTSEKAAANKMPVSNDETVKKEDPKQLSLDLGDIPIPKKVPVPSTVPPVTPPAAAAGIAGPLAAVATIATLPYIGASIEKRKIDANPNAPGLEFNPYAMEKRGETDVSGKPLTAGRAGKLNARRAAGAVRWGEINQAVESDLTDEELFTQYGRNREDLKKWLAENKDGKNFYDINTKAPAVADREPIKNIKPPQPESGESPTITGMESAFVPTPPGTSSVEQKRGEFFNKIKGTYNYIKENTNQDLSGGVGVPQAEQMISSNVESRKKEESSGPILTQQDTLDGGIVSQKSLFGNSFLGSLFSKKNQKIGQFMASGSDSNVIENPEGNVQSYKTGRLLGQRVSGGLFGRDTYKVSLEGKDSEAEYDTQLTKKDYMQIQNLVKQGKYDEAEAKFKELKAAQQERDIQVRAPASPEEMITPTTARRNFSNELMSESSQNKNLTGEMQVGGQVQPIVIQNNNSTNTQTAIPIKAEPRMQSSFTRYNDSRAAY